MAGAMRYGRVARSESEKDFIIAIYSGESRDQQERSGRSMASIAVEKALHGCFQLGLGER